MEQEIPHVGQEVAPPEPYDPEAHLRIRSEIESLSEDLSTHQNHFQSLLSRERSIQTDLSIPSSESSRLSQRLIFNEKQISSFEGQLQLIASQKINQAKRLATFSHDAAVLKSALETTTQKLDSREKMQDLTTYWKQQLQDTATTKGAFLTHCRAAYIQHINRLLPNILSSLCLDSEGLLSTQQLLDFKLTSDFKLEPAEGALALTRRSRGQTTRTYLALFLALWVQSRERCAFRPGFVWMDEVVEVVDEAGMEGLRAWLEGYLRSEGGGGGRAFLLTHRDVVGGRVVECRKTRDGGTEYVLRD